MVESTLNKALSGQELREAILFDIRKVLEQDDRFSAHLAYDGYSFKAKIEVSLPSAVQQQVTREISGSDGTIPADGETIDAIFETERPQMSPNEVRYETEQPVPTLVTDEKGNTVEKLVSYAGKDRFGRPINIKNVRTAPPGLEKVKRNTVKGIDT